MTSPREVIREWTARLMANSELAGSIGASFKFVITGKDGGTWVIDCREPVGVNEGDGAADCTLELLSEDFVAIAEKRLNPQAAFMAGKIRLAGDLSQALKLSRLFAK